MRKKVYKVVFDETKKDNTKLDAWYCECNIFSAKETLLSRCRFCIAWNIVVQWGFEPTDVNASVVLTKLGCLNRPLSVDRFLDSRCQSRLCSAWGPRIFQDV